MLFAALTSLAFAGFTDLAYAGRREVNNVVELDKSAANAVKKARSAFRKLSAGDKNRAIAKRAGRSLDSDDDGASDYLEPAGNLCDDDSDDDGQRDGQEYENEHSPNDDDSDGDGNSDGTERNVKGLISSLDQSQILVGNSAFAIDGGTVFLLRHNEPGAIGDFSTGDCVEVEGHGTGGSYTADKIKEDNDC